MRTSERLRKLKKYVYDNLCKGRQMKTPAKDGDFSRIVRAEPKCYLGFYPTRPDESYGAEEDALNTAPSILIMPCGGYVKNMEEQRFDRYNNIHRPKQMGQSLTVQVLFTVYEDGIRLPGFVDGAETGEYDMTLIREGTENGLMTLLNWMDDFDDLLLSAKFIPGTDLSLIEQEMKYETYSDQKYIKDDRPLYQGVSTVTFKCYAEEYNPEIENLLR